MNGFSRGFMLGALALLMGAGTAQADLWTLLPPDPALDPAAAARGSALEASPGTHQQRTALDASALERLLAASPPEQRDPTGSAGPAIELALPTPDGTFERFAVVESTIMEPGLAQWLGDRGWPMRTFAAHSLDRPGVTAHLDWGGPNGFHAVVLSSTGTWYVDPETPGSFERYVSYHKRDNPSDQPLRCDGEDLHGLTPEFLAQALGKSTLEGGASTGGQLRTYRLAYAVTGDYTVNLAEGSVVTAQANVVTIINRVNAIFERELSVRFLLIGDNADIVYDDPDTDPYTQSSASTMLGENQANIDAVIGPANYDIGHVMYNGGSGIASLFSPCGGGKARGVSGALQATGESIVVDMIAHELGHQFGAFHTFNSVQNSCSGNRTGNSAWEPGSGTTIMSYSGICGADNVQTFSNDYFHGGSLDQMLDFVAGGGSCAGTPSAGNPNAPIVSATGGYTLPISTPFELDVDSASDADGDALTFTWEQFDLGAPASLADGDQGDNPIVRSLPPGTDTHRIVDGTVFGDTLPTTTRDLNFRVTARDNRVGGGRVGEANIALSVNGNSGPFEVTFPNGGERLTTASQHILTWDVAGTNAPPVNTARVDILLSTDGGESYDTVLAQNVPNDGAHLVTLPQVSSATARVKVRARGNIYFDNSDANFSINAFEQCVNPALDIPQFQPISADLVVTGQDGVDITDLDVSLRVTYPVVGALAASIQHVGTGTTVQLISRPGVDEDIDQQPFGCDRANIDATLDDEAGSDAESACSGIPPALSGRLTPTEPLSAFDGEALNGTWRLTVREPFWSFGGTKVFEGFCIQAPLPIAAPPPDSTLFTSGFEDGETSN